MTMSETSAAASTQRRPATHCSPRTKSWVSAMTWSASQEKRISRWRGLASFSVFQMEK